MKKIRLKLKKLLDKRRYKHTLRVVKTAIELAKYWKVDIKKAETAALFHDFGRQFKTEELIDLAKKYKLRIDRYEKKKPLLLHGRIAIEIVKKEYGLKDKNILKAILSHTTGDSKMSKLEKIIYLADAIEPGRRFNGLAKLRKTSFCDLNKAVALASKYTLDYLKSKEELIHPKTLRCYWGHKG